jgi:hypothetical protein
MIVGFGSIFDNITLVRYNEDDSEQERFIVPIGFASKENYVDRLSDDPNLDKKTRITLPTMAYEMTGISYDASRKQNTNIQNFAQTPTGVKSQYNPVPYNFDFSLYLYVRNIEDGSQIIEHILPYFTPDYTLKLNLIPEMGIIKDIPILLNDVSQEIISEGDKNIDTRIIIWTLNFTVKGFIFGATSPAGLIKTSITNILNNTIGQNVVIFNVANTGIGKYQTDEIVYQGYSLNTSTATGKVVDFKTIGINKELYLTDVFGNFVSNQPIIGSKTNANYTFTSYYVTPYQYAKITVVPNPITANANSNYTYTTTIKEY